VKNQIKQMLGDIFIAVLAGLLVGTSSYFFQNSNNFVPGGIGGLATITYHIIQNTGIEFPWGVLNFLYNIPILILLSIFVNRRLGFLLIVYLFVQSSSADIYSYFGCKAYCLLNNKEDFDMIYAAIANGVISGFGFSIMLRRFGASGGVHAIAVLIKKWKPATNIAFVGFILNSSVAVISFFVFGMQITPLICTLINLFISSMVVNYALEGIKNAYKFEIITDNPDEITKELIETLGHSVTEIRVHGMYSDTDKFMLVCIIRKRQIGMAMKIIKRYGSTFAYFERVNEVFGRFKK